MATGPLSCAAVALVALVLSAMPASAMEFSLSRLPDGACASDCPEVIVATGEIELDSDERFFRFVKSRVMGRQVTSVVLMTSPGGNLVGSLKLGIVMRQLGFSIMVGQVRGEAFVTGRCYSACAYTLAGGRRRIVPEGSEVGVHKAWTLQPGQLSTGEGGTASGSMAGRIAAEGYGPVLERYLGMMGVSRQLVALADATPSTSIRVLSRKELTRLRVITPDRPAPRRAGKERS
jgi:hypothetical protein